MMNRSVVLAVGIVISAIVAGCSLAPVRPPSPLEVEQCINATPQWLYDYELSLYNNPKLAKNCRVVNAQGWALLSTLLPQGTNLRQFVGDVATCFAQATAQRNTETAKAMNECCAEASSNACIDRVSKKFDLRSLEARLLKDCTVLHGDLLLQQTAVVLGACSAPPDVLGRFWYQSLGDPKVLSTLSLPQSKVAQQVADKDRQMAAEPKTPQECLANPMFRIAVHLASGPSVTVMQCNGMPLIMESVTLPAAIDNEVTAQARQRNLTTDMSRSFLQSLLVTSLPDSFRRSFGKNTETIHEDNRQEGIRRKATLELDDEQCHVDAVYRKHPQVRVGNMLNYSKVCDVLVHLRRLSNPSRAAELTHTISRYLDVQSNIQPSSQGVTPTSRPGSQ